MNSTRRQFVAATLTAMPALSYAGTVTRDQKPGAVGDDPIWAQIQDDLKRLDEEVRSRRPTAQTVRAFESTLRFHAAHAASKGRGQSVGEAVRRRMRERGRAAFLADAIDVHRQHERHARSRVDSLNRELPPRREPSSDELGAMAERLLRGNYASILKESAEAVRMLREGLPAEPAAGMRLIATGAMMQDYCGDVRRALEGLSSLKDLICVMVIIAPELFAAECAALQFEVWLIESMVWIFCTVI